MIRVLSLRKQGLGVLDEGFSIFQARKRIVMRSLLKLHVRPVPHHDVLMDGPGHHDRTYKEQCDESGNCQTNNICHEQKSKQNRQTNCTNLPDYDQWPACVSRGNSCNIPDCAATS